MEESLRLQLQLRLCLHRDLLLVLTPRLRLLHALRFRRARRVPSIRTLVQQRAVADASAAITNSDLAKNLQFEMERRIA